MRNTDTWLITALTNLHAGSGDADYGIVDKLVQRDAVTGLPTVHSSGIKGALREAFDVQQLADTEDVFGSDNRKGNSDNLKQGSYHFYGARLLALPVRSSHDLFYLATCREIIIDFLTDMERLGATNPASDLSAFQTLSTSTTEIKPGSPVYFGKNHGRIQLEDFEAEHNGMEINLSSKFGDRLALFHCDDFQQLCKELPVIARNHLENGISSNLWYEEVVPRESRFYCMISKPNAEDTKLEIVVKNNLKNLLQIGGNATVGYGLCKFEKL